MGYNLDVPDGMVVRAVAGADGERCVEFYTGRSPTRYGAEEVRKLIAELDRWYRRALPVDREAPEPSERPMHQCKEECCLPK